MPSSPSTPRRATPARRRQGRPPASSSTVRTSRVPASAAGSATEPPPKRRRYIPGGPGGGGRFVDEDGVEIPTEGNASARPRIKTAAAATSDAASHKPASTTTPAFPRRERSTRTRTATSRFEPDDDQFSSAAAITSAVIQSEGYKPREERGWEEFHPNLDIEATFMVFRAEDVDGTAKPAPAPATPSPATAPAPTRTAGGSTPTRSGTAATPQAPDEDPAKPAPDAGGEAVVADTPPTTRRRVGRPPRDPVAFYAARAAELAGNPKTPKVLPIHNQTAKERLDLKLPSYRKTDRIALFESKTFGQARYVERSMMNVGYQESDNYIRPERRLIKAIDANPEEEVEQSAAARADKDKDNRDRDRDKDRGAGSGSAAVSGSGSHAQHHAQAHTAHFLGRVEYDMDEQDDMWLERCNERRREAGLETITREIFEITITKIEKEWHALEKRIPKPNPKPPQTHRPRSSSAAAVNGETQAGEEQDSKCAICDDGDCENTNAIVFCDGCDLAVHQECYGVPFIPEGQWLCRKCQLIGRGIPTCIFCPNTDGAFKQTNSSKWAHLLCSMWIPEVSLGNHTFMEPVMDVEKVPKTRWRLTCYICNQRMGACIQCGNKACYQAFHVTCARRARLYLKMKNSQGALAVLDGSMVLKAFCDRHCPADYAKENGVGQATRDAKRFYKKTMKGRLWATSQDSAAELAASHRHAVAERPQDESQTAGERVSALLGGTSEKKRGGAGQAQQQKCWWRLPSGAPVIPLAVLEIIEAAVQRFPFNKRKEFVTEACRYWTLKREARRGAALLKRLQLQMETFSSMELTRRNFSAMGPSGKARLERRIAFAKMLLHDLEQLQALSEDIVRRERDKLEAAELEQDFVDTCYFPVFKLLLPVIEKALALDKNVFQQGLMGLQAKLDERYYTTTLAFAHDLCEVVHVGINSEPKADPSASGQPATESMDASPTKHNSFSETRDRRRLAKRILKAVQPQFELALRAEADITGKPYPKLVKELEGMLEASLELRQASITVSQEEVAADHSREVIMVDAADAGQITVADRTTTRHADVGEGGVDSVEVNVAGGEDRMDIDGPSDEGLDNIDVDTSVVVKPGGGARVNNSISSSATSVVADQEGREASSKSEPPPLTINGIKASDTPPADNGYMPNPPLQAPGPAGQIQSHPQDLQNHHHPGGGPLTPPQSNGALGGGPSDTLTDGGVSWYLKNFHVEGTSAAEEVWAGRDAVRSLSEELTDMDDEELNGLEFDVEDSTITASPADTNDNGGGPGAALLSAPVATPKRKRSGGSGGLRSGGAASRVKKAAVRSSARRR